MIPFANETVTLWRKMESGYEPFIIPNCWFKRNSVRSTSADGAMTQREECICRIPVGNIHPTPGDAIALGEHANSVKNEIELVRMLEKLRPHGAFRVKSVSDNVVPGVPFPHFAARGE